MYMLKIYQFQSGSDETSIRELFWEYLQWANTRINVEFGVDFDIKSMLERDMSELEKFCPPDGRLLLAKYVDDIAGLACMHKIQVLTCEIKRMYVRPKFRKKGVGRALVERLLVEARCIGYTRVRLDSARFMQAAHSLYRSMGFKEISPYPESEIPDAFKPNWIFMEMTI
jgi:GNAT superfamily N-acetyltransferase